MLGDIWILYSVFHFSDTNNYMMNHYFNNSFLEMKNATLKWEKKCVLNVLCLFLQNEILPYTLFGNIDYYLENDHIFILWG